MIEKVLWRKRKQLFELLGNEENVVKLSAQNSWAHEFIKFRLSWECLQKKHFFLTEGVLKYGKGRVDFCCLSEGIIKEVKVSESDESIEEKRKKYPKEFEFVVVEA